MVNHPGFRPYGPTSRIKGFNKFILRLEIHHPSSNDPFEGFPAGWYSLKRLRVLLTSAGRFSVICDH